MKWPLNISKDISSFLMVRSDVLMFHWLRQHVISSVSTESRTFLTSKGAIEMNAFSHWDDSYRKGLVFLSTLTWEELTRLFFGASESPMLRFYILKNFCFELVEDSLTCIPVSSAVLRVSLCLLFGSSEIEAVIFLNARPRGVYLGFPHISVGDCEIHLQHRGATGYQCSA